MNLIALLYYKYTNFFIAEISSLLVKFNLDALPLYNVALPIGISFFTFQKISYLVDVYRGRKPPAKSFIDYALYVALFPQLIAGPIIRYHDIAKQLIKRNISRANISYGFYRFSLGLAKKVLIADTLGVVSNAVFALPADQVPVAYAWLGILCYAFQIYYDFSGYSDMAIGLGRMMGFRFLENFNFPYIAQSITEFWQRWHISLSSWIKEYLYIPLGGNRHGFGRTYFNLSLVFLLSGLWHGASWNFVLWGIFHGFFLCLDRICLQRILRFAPKVFRIMITFITVLFGWVLFRSESITMAFAYYSNLFGLKTSTFPVSLTWGDLMNNFSWFVLSLAILFLGLSISNKGRSIASSFNQATEKINQLNFKLLVALVLLLLAIMKLTNNSFHSFIYFRF